MKINDVQTKGNITAMIPKENLPQSTRINVVLNQTAYEKALEKFKGDLDDTLKRIKPEGFDDKLQKFFVTTKLESELTDEEKKKCEELKADPDYAEFKETMDKVNSDYSEAQKKIIEENDYDVKERAYSDADLEAIATVLPSGGTTTVKLNGKDTSVPNDELLHLILWNFA